MEAAPEPGPPARPDVAPVDAQLRAEIQALYAREFGAEPDVFAERVSEGIKLDLLLYPPTPRRPYRTIATLGMSEAPQATPDGAELWARSELVLTLPPTWPLAPRPDGTSPLSDENYYWPLRLLKDLARLPVTQRTWLAWGHTVDNQEPYAPRTPLSAAILGDASSMRQSSLYTRRGAVWFYGVHPIHPAELALKLEHDAEALLERLRDAGIVDAALNPVRPSVA